MGACKRHLLLFCGFHKQQQPKRRRIEENCFSLALAAENFLLFLPDFHLVCETAVKGLVADDFHFVGW